LRVVEGPLCAVLAEIMHGAALCCFSRENAQWVAAGLLAVLWGSVLGLSVLCALQGDTALMKATQNGDEALLNQLIAVNANVCALNANVIYSSCACVSHQSNNHLITLLKFYLRIKTCHSNNLVIFLIIIKAILLAPTYCPWSCLKYSLSPS
jgi:hypothetical protein